MRDDKRNAVVLVHGLAELDQRELAVQERLGGEESQREDDLWPDELDLPDEVGAARLDFVRQRIAVVGRAVLEDVADEDVLPPQVNRLEDLGEELSGGPDEGAPAGILIRSGRFTNDDE